MQVNNNIHEILDVYDIVYSQTLLIPIDPSFSVTWIQQDSNKVKIVLPEMKWFETLHIDHSASTYLN